MNVHFYRKEANKIFTYVKMIVHLAIECEIETLNFM